MPEQTLGGIPLGLGMVMKINIFEFSCYRGKEFRKEFFRLEEVCSLIPSDVHLMALTEICKVLSMKKPKTYHPLLNVQSLY